MTQCRRCGHRILGLNGLGESAPEMLPKRRGRNRATFNPRSRATSITCPGCGHDVEIPTAPAGTELSSAEAVWNASKDLIPLRHEEFHVYLLNTKNKLLRRNLVSVGSLAASLVHPREAFRAAVMEPAQAIIFVHNHPTGDPSPSDEDATLTRRLVQAGDVLGIRVLDHVVIGAHSWYSFAESGRLR